MLDDLGAVSDSFGVPTVDVEAADWLAVHRRARDELGLTFFDWLSVYDEAAGGQAAEDGETAEDDLAVVTHLWSVPRREGVLVRTRVRGDPPTLPTLTAVFAGANWHERESFEMFGIVFAGHPLLIPLLLPDGFEGHPLRKDFVLASRVAKSWPGAKEPGESDAEEAPSRRKMAPPGVPDSARVGERLAMMPVWALVVAKLGACLLAFLTLPLLVGQLEHKAMAHMQSRLGPMYAGGFHGWAQLIADGVKFAQKEPVVPAAADRAVFTLAPAVALLPYLLVLLVIPIGPGGQVAQSLDVGLFFALAAIGIAVLGPVMAGWASANKYALIGGMRAAAQLMAYELPLVLSAASAAMAAGTLSLPGIVEQWRWWWLPYQGVGAVVFFLSGLAELRRPPFDMPVADAEIVFGPYTEYPGLRFAFFLLAEYAGIVVFAALTTVLFLGGWRGPFLDVQLGWLWTLTKGVALSFVVIWLRVSYPRLRADQLQRFAWTVLVPLAFAQLLVTGVVEVARA